MLIAIALADIRKKHSRHALAGDVTIADWAHGPEFLGADGIVVTGHATGMPADLPEASRARKAYVLPVFVGSGVSPDHVARTCQAADGVIAGGWHHYHDPTCDYACKVTEYHYWALISLLGAQNYPWRIGEIADDNGVVNVNDLLDLLAAYGTAGPNGDINGDGTVNVLGVLAILEAWGDC